MVCGQINPIVVMDASQNSCSELLLNLDDAVLTLGFASKNTRVKQATANSETDPRSVQHLKSRNVKHRPPDHDS